MTDPWTNKHGIKRLAYLKVTHPDPAPASVKHDDAHCVAEHLKQLRTYASHTIDPELIEDRKVLWRQELSCAQYLPDWMTLMAPDDLKICPT